MVEGGENPVDSNESRIVTRDFALLFIASFLFMGSLFLMIPILPLYMEDIAGATTTQVGLLMGTGTFFAFIVRPFAGRLSDRHSRKAIMFAGSVALIGASLLYLVFKTLATLPIAFVLLGAGVACFHTASLTFIGDIAPAAHRGRSMSWFQASFNLGIMLAPILAEFLYDRFGYTPVFIAAAITAGASMLMLLTVSEGKLVDFEGVTGQIHFRDAKKLIILVSVAVFSGTVAVGAVEAFLPLFAEAREIPRYALFFTIFAGLLIVFRLLGGWIPDRFGRKRVVIFSLSIIAASMLTLSLAWNFAVMCVSATFFGLGFAYLSPTLSAMLVDRVSQETLGGAFGIYTAAFEGGIAFGAIVLGPVITSFGYDWGFRLISFISLAGVVFFLLAFAYLTGNDGPRPRETAAE